MPIVTLEVERNCKFRAKTAIAVAAALWKRDAWSSGGLRPPTVRCSHGSAVMARVLRAIELQLVRLPLQMHNAENQHFAADSTHSGRAGACRNPVQSRSFA